MTIWDALDLDLRNVQAFNVWLLKYARDKWEQYSALKPLGSLAMASAATFL